MQTHKPYKIDINDEYPCPCRRRGRLTPIALTEAFGCTRCQQIFVVQDNGHAIEQLSTHYPYKRAWRWTGYQWMVINPSLGKGSVPLMLMLMLGMVFVLLVIMLNAPLNLNTQTFRVIMAAIALFAIVSFMLWLTCRR